MLSFKRKLLFVFVVVAVIIGGVFSFFYFYPTAVKSRAGVEQMQRYAENVQSLEQELATDIYGGRTPEETLQLFVAALREGDTAKAAKFFMPEADPFVSPHLSWAKFEKGLEKIEKDGRLNEFADEILKYNQVSENSGLSAWLASKNSNGKTISEIRMVSNTYADIWKLDNVF